MRCSMDGCKVDSYCCEEVYFKDGTTGWVWVCYDCYLILKKGGDIVRRNRDGEIIPFKAIEEMS